MQATLICVVIIIAIIAILSLIDLRPFVSKDKLDE
jgi:Tfp pilus assembly protein PilE